MSIKLTGRIDSNNAAVLEKDLLTELEGHPGAPVVLDASSLEYISSAGLRVLLRIRKQHPDMKITGVSSEVYEILDMTGFTEMMQVEKDYRVVSIEGCEEIGRGANGTIYRIDRDNVVKVYNNADALEDIRHEREVAKLALILGIPTAISYDVVRVGESYGSVFELLNARSFSKILATEPDKLDWCVQEYVALLRKIHGTSVPDGKLPDSRKWWIGVVNQVRNELPEDAWNKLRRMVEAIPYDDHMIHGDYHTKNVELQNDEVLLIDMDTLEVGHPIFELACMFNAFIGFYEMDPQAILAFQGFDYETAKSFWRKSLAAYMGTGCEAKLREVEDKARILGYTRMIRRSILRNGLETEKGRAEIAIWREHLLELLEKVDTLVFARNEMEIEATDENLPAVQSFVRDRLGAVDCPAKAQTQIGAAAEEIFINIAHYTYTPDKRKATVRLAVSDDPVTVSVTFVDHGVPYDPLAIPDPDVPLSAAERPVGGPGVFLTKQLMDDVSYEYRDGQIILTLKKKQ